MLQESCVYHAFGNNSEVEEMELTKPCYTTGVCAMLPGMRWMVAMNDSNCNVAAIATAIQLLLSNAEK